MSNLIDQPLQWMHPQRVGLPGAFDASAVGALLNPMINQQFSPLTEHPAHRWWAEHWPLMAPAATLLGAYRLWPHLAWGGLSQRLSPAQRRFAGLALGPREPMAPAPEEPLELRLAAGGLRALLDALPDCPGLHQRVPLVFSPRAQQLASAWPTQPYPFATIVQAVQHARYS